MSGYRFSLTPTLICLGLLAACGPNPSQRPFTPGALEPLRLMDAAAAAGYIAGEMQTDIPASIRPRLPFNTLPYNDSLLNVLRDKYDLRGVIAGAQDEWQAQLMLNHWVHTRITNGTPTSEPQNALEILDLAAQGKQFWCSYYAITYTQCALALGWQARKLGLDRYHPEEEGKGSRHHGATEVWSNRFRKWIYIDPQSDLHFEKDGVPLSAWEIRGEWLKDKGLGVEHVVGVPPDTLRKNPAVVWWDLKAEDETSLFFWLFYTDEFSTWEKDSPSKFLFPQDSANAGLTWYQGGAEGKSRLHTGYLNDLFLKTDRLEDVYWTVGVTEAALAGTAKGRLSLSLDSYCPDLDYYEVNLDGQGWKRVEDPANVIWPLNKGASSLALRTINRAGGAGPETTARMLLK